MTQSMDNITASEIAGLGVGTLLLCATIAAPKVDAFVSASQRRLFDYKSHCPFVLFLFILCISIIFTWYWISTLILWEVKFSFKLKRSFTCWTISKIHLMIMTFYLLGYHLLQHDDLLSLDIAEVADISLSIKTVFFHANGTIKNIH